MLTIRQLNNTYTAEQILLILLARLHFKTATKEEAVNYIAQNNIDWDLLYKITRAHGLRPLAYFILKKYVIDIPKLFEGRLQKSYDKTRRKNLKMTIAAAKLMANFKEQGIVIIPYKGPVFSHSYFGDIALRESSDLDFLVAPGDVDEIENYFINNNYTAKTAVPKAYLKYYKRHFKDIVYRTPGDDAFSIEMHWRLMEKFSGDYPTYNFFLPHLTSYAIGGVYLNKLSSTYDLIAVISNHFVKDMSIKFKYMVDVAALINKEGATINQQELFKTAEEYGFKKRLLIGLALTENLLGIKINNSQVEAVDVSAFLPIPLAFPVQLPRLYINEPEFISRALKMQDNNWHKVKFIVKVIGYAFLPTYEDINVQKHLPKHPLMLTITRPFRLILRSIQSKKL